MALLPRPVTMMIWSQPAASASSTPYWMMGLSTSGSISLGMALVAGRKRVPRPAAGKTALRTFMGGMRASLSVRETACYIRCGMADVVCGLPAFPRPGVAHVNHVIVDAGIAHAHLVIRDVVVAVAERP